MAGESIGSGVEQAACRQAQGRFKWTGEFLSLARHEPLLRFETLRRNDR